MRKMYNKGDKQEISKNEEKDVKRNNKINVKVLIVVIIIIIVLASIGIVYLVGDNGIIAKQNESEKIENQELGKVEEEETGTVQKTGERAGNPDAGTGLYTVNSTIDGKEIGDATNPTIPAGFKPMETDTSWGDGSNKPTEDNLNKGLVITDGTSEFVWIPVPNVVSKEEKGGTNLGESGETPMVRNLGTEENPRYKGMLYNFNNTGSTVMKNCTTTTSSYRDPDIVREYDTDSTLKKYQIGVETGHEMLMNLEIEYSDMIESVEKHGGFYVGRYEISFEGNEPQSKYGVTSSNAASNSQAWYGLYDKLRNYNKSSAVKSSMMWGSQYDAMLNWMLKNNINVSQATPTDTTIGATTRNTARTTGTQPQDRLNNVFDLLGNSYEWTLEAYGPKKRVNRSGRSSSSYSVSNRSSISPRNALSYLSARLVLYVK